MNPVEAAKRQNDLLFALLAEFMEWHTGVAPTAEQVEKNIVDRKTAVAPPPEPEPVKAKAEAKKAETGTKKGRW